ncbi:X-ray repair cross-complementing protein 5 [Andrena cerasifolii]|uniref:X-ray repair cross-complementing protein 5 n=1 Tax=Andrena cerasifolii TaxID=2819439 RepID=UPI00403771E0
MPPKAKKEALVLLMNIGVTCSDAQNNPSLLEKEKHIAQRIIEKKIFLRPKDEIAVILMGSSVTKNSLNTEHVGEFIDFQIPNWNTVEKIIQLHGTSFCSNWVEALVATVEYIKQNVIDNCMKKIVLMSDFNEHFDIISQFKADVIAERLQAEGIQLVTIGEELLDGRPGSSMKVSEVLLKDLHKKIDGQHLTFDNTISDLRFYVKAPVVPSPWYADLIFIDFKIPIVSCIKTEPDKFTPWKTMKDDKKVVSKRQHLDRQRRTYEPDEIVTGYKYGGIFIPVEKRLEEDMSYKSGPRIYAIHSFTKKRNIDLDYWYDNTIRVVFPSTRVKNAAKPFYSLVQAMHNKNLVAITKKVYNNNFAPRMVALFPCIDVPDEPWCLVEISLPFAEDRRVMDTRPLKSVSKQLSSEQHEALDNLIDSLMLPDTEDSYVVGESQHLLPGCIPNPAVQHRWHMLSHRALNPNKPLPPMEDYLKDLLEVPLVKERSKCHLQRIAELFQLESIDLKAKKKAESKASEAVSGENETGTDEPIKVDDKVDSQHDSFNDSDLLMDIDCSDADLDAQIDKF